MQTLRHALDHRVAQGSYALCLVAAVVLLLLTMGITVLDVVLRQFGGAVPGATELVTQSMRVSFALALPYSFWCGGHIFVELLVERLPKVLQLLCALLAYTLSASVMALLTWRLYVHMLKLRSYGEVTQDLSLPLHLTIWPLVIGSALSVFVLLVRLILTLIPPSQEGEVAL